MKIVLIRSPFIEVQTGAPIGLAYLQGALLNHNVRVIDLSLDVSKHAKFTCGQFTRNFTIKTNHPAYAYAYSQLDRYCEAILGLKPDIIGFHLAYSTTDYSLAMAKKFHGKTRLIAGGPDATYKAEELYKSGLFDAIVRGYGEEAIQTALHEKGIFSANLDKSKEYYPSYRNIEFRKYGGKIPILTTRGCPHSCTFCSQHLRYHYHSIDEVCKQIISTPKNCGIMLNDSNLNVNAKRTKDLFGQISKVIGKRYIHAFGFEVNPKFGLYINEFAKCNFSEVRIGIESGSTRVRKEMRKPHFTNQMVRETIKHMTRRGAIVWAQFIFCYPSETNEDRKKTLELMRQISSENPKDKVRIYWFRFVVHHGTEEFFKQRYGVTTNTIRDWSSPNYNPKKVKEIANGLRPRLPSNAQIQL